MHSWLRSVWDKLDVMVRKIPRKALGLPLRTHTEDLLALGVHISGAEIAEVQQHSQLARLSTTTTGRRILEEMGLNPMQIETNSLRIPKHVQENVTVAPIPRNTHPVHDEGRRRVRATALLKKLEKGGTSFVDAAAYRDGKKFTTVVVDQSGSTTNCTTVCTTYPQVAEQLAIALALLNSPYDEAARILNSFTSDEIVPHTTYWFPAHGGSVKGFALNPNEFFNAWREALLAAAHRSWADQKTFIFDETPPNAYYVINKNNVVIPAGILQHPFFFVDGPPAVNYGGIGMVIGHEIMHGYDVGGSEYDDESTSRPWTTPEYLEKYVEKTLCLRESHKAAEPKRARQSVLNDTIDSENLADLVGAVISHAAFSSLPPLERSMTLPGLNLTAEHLFFVSQCAKWCASRRATSPRYASGRSRCIVPLMNMVEFSEAFGCASGTPMNPPKKCLFWA
ncbi:hypothetical protein HPB50_004153 [Hyalomma asiaticum]|uniref:Uncharacterized protein n=1 Tax=Hyalomma asiaticum TaxID=266040 RepID=A0ACB7SCF2_HYAAI|nr:hypothetical protein HPB50_004153 [Hyalomma asiaticum]